MMNAIMLLARFPIGTVHIAYSTVDDTARAGQDYRFTKGTLVFRPGQVEQTISVPLIDDAIVEPDESFVVKLFPQSIKTKGTECAVGDPHKACGCFV